MRNGIGASLVFCLSLCLGGCRTPEAEKKTLAKPEVTPSGRHSPEEVPQPRVQPEVAPPRPGDGLPTPSTPPEPGGDGLPTPSRPPESGEEPSKPKVSIEQMTFAPEISHVDPLEGGINEKIRLTITGSYFASNMMMVYLGTGLCEDVTVETAEKITCTVEFSKGGKYGIRVFSHASNKENTYAKPFIVKFHPNPIIEKVEPTYGLPAHGIKLTVTGKNFTEDAKVMLHRPINSYSEDPHPAVCNQVQVTHGGTVLTCHPEAHENGPVDISIAQPKSESPADKERVFSYGEKAPPLITHIHPVSVIATEGAKIVIEGEKFEENSEVWISLYRSNHQNSALRYPCEALHRIDTTKIECTAPKVGLVNSMYVFVANPDKTENLNGFKIAYIESLPLKKPVITAITPTHGKAGTVLTITGENLYQNANYQFMKLRMPKMEGQYSWISCSYLKSMQRSDTKMQCKIGEEDKILPDEPVVIMQPTMTEFILRLEKKRAIGKNYEVFAHLEKAFTLEP